MNKKFSILTLTLAVLFAISSTSSAQERAMEPVAAAGQNASDIFGLTVLGNGELQVNPGKVFTEGYDDGASLPYLISHSKSVEYPAWAVRQGWQGMTTLALEILPNGEVGRTMVMKSAGKNILDKAALKAVKSWKFQPAIKNGKGVVSCIQVPVSFELN